MVSCLLDTCLPGQYIPLSSMPPLIPLPIDVTVLEDIYCVGESPTTRWRSFINAKNWSPEYYNDLLIKRKAYHARIVYEMLFIESFTDSSWLSLGSLKMIKDVAYLEMRVAEIELMSFQLTAGMIGLRSVDKKAIYHAAVTMFLTNLYLAELIMDTGTKTKTQRKEYVDLVNVRPLSSDSPKEHAKACDEFIWGIQEFLKRGKLFVEANNSIVEPLGKKLSECVKAFDKVAYVFPN